MSWTLPGGAAQPKIVRAAGLAKKIVAGRAKSLPGRKEGGPHARIIVPVSNIVFGLAC